MSAADQNIAEAVRDMLENDSAVASIAGDRISPYARNRDDDFPAVTYSVPREEFQNTAGETGGARIAEISIACMARRHQLADDLAEAVVAAAQNGTHAGTCLEGIRVQSLERDFLDSYDGAVALIYRTTVALVCHTDGT